MTVISELSPFQHQVMVSEQQRIPVVKKQSSSNYQEMPVGEELRLYPRAELVVCQQGSCKKTSSNPERL